jgi:hypothetical protein
MAQRGENSEKEGKIGGIFDPCYAIRLFLPAGKVCLSD